MKAPEYWNHNTAYYRWIAERISDCGSVLDVGCGDGALAAALDDGTRAIVGIDPDERCVREARRKHPSPRMAFERCSFEDFAADRSFAAVLFIASLHHMEMAPALIKAKELLSPGGKLLVVGLAKPSTVPDYVVELLRVIPSRAVSALKRMRTSEELGIPASYEFPEMNAVRSAAKELLPGARLRYGLHYRYLLEWVKK